MEDGERDDELASVETSGASVDEAIQQALDQLDLTPEDVDVEVLDPGGAGRPARVRVTELPYEDEDEDVEELEALAGPAGVPAALAEDAADAEADEDDELGEDEEDEEEDEAEDGQGAYVEGEEYEELPLSEAATVAVELLERVLVLIGIPSQIDVEEVEEEADEPAGLPTVYLDISGENMGLLIGRHGETLASLQFLVGLMLQRRLGGRKARVIVDVEGYRERRARLLRDIAFRAAERAQRFRQPVILDPMIPAERRIVHLSLQQHSQVTTHSIGEGANRRVVVTPHKAV